MISIFFASVVYFENPQRFDVFQPEARGSKYKHKDDLSTGITLGVDL